MIRRPPRSTRMTHSFPTRRSSDLDATVQSMPDASPAKWHLAHTSWFFEAFILRDVARHEPFDPSYAYLFNSYYESEGARQPRPLRGMLTRPSLDRVLDYRRHVDGAMEAVLQTPSPRQAELAELGGRHEQQRSEEHTSALQPLMRI